LTNDYTMSFRANLGYGDGYSDTGILPIFEHFFAGGPNSVRGWKAFSLGPRDSNDDPVGGNMLVTGSAELLFPVPGLAEMDTLRMGAFFDIGNVFLTDSDEFDFDAGDLRYSTGLSSTWASPLGILTFSYAFPLNDEPGDDTEEFQFTFGSTF
jgi:outer membrane protein insertion porin family